MAQGLTRRNFLKGMGVVGAGAAAVAGVTACSPTTVSESSSSSSSESSWRTPPDEITDFAQEIDCDVVVCGHGYAGITACRELAEQGASVYLIEKQAEDTFAAVGNEAGILNASILKERGVPEIDPVEFFQNFMLITMNYPNQELIMKFAQNSGTNMDWYLEGCTEDDLASMTTAFFPKTEHQMDELGGIKFWPSVCSFYSEECNQTKIHGYNREFAKEAGAEFLFSTEAQYVIMDDDGSVAGLVATGEDGNIKFNCKAVVIACGGFGGNTEMMNDLMPDMYNALVGDEALSSMSSNDGRGVQMAYWAGAHLETCPIPGMNMKGLSVPGKMNCLPQAVWLDENGKRFCNEYYPTSEQRGFSTVYTARKTKCAIVDSNFPTYRQYTLPQHAGFEASDENIASLQSALDSAYATYAGTADTSDEEEAEGGEAMSAVSYIADDTLEGLAAQLGYEGDALTNFLETIETYNSYCEAGADQDFGRDAAVLFPVDTAPFYAATFDPELGETMVTCGGIITDGDQNALDENFEPIPGLYVSGNDCGRRFGYEYITPIPGLSLGLAITLGRECGKSVAAFLQDA